MPKPRVPAYGHQLALALSAKEVAALENSSCPALWKFKLPQQPTSHSPIPLSLIGSLLMRRVLFPRSPLTAAKLTHRLRDGRI